MRSSGAGDLQSWCGKGHGSREGEICLWQTPATPRTRSPEESKEGTENSQKSPPTIVSRKKKRHSSQRHTAILTYGEWKDSLMVQTRGDERRGEQEANRDAIECGTCCLGVHLRQKKWRCAVWLQVGKRGKLWKAGSRSFF